MKPTTFAQKLYGPKLAALLERHVRTAMTDAGLQSGGGRLPVEHSTRFINELVGLDIKYDDFLSVIDFDTCGPTGETLDDWELNEVGDIRKHTESTAPTHQVTETHSARTITPKWIDLYCPLSYERVGRWIRRGAGEGAKTGSGVKKVLDALKQKGRNEFQNLIINGDTDSTDAHLLILNGILKIMLSECAAARLNATTWAATPDVKTMLNRQYKSATQIRHGKALALPGFGYIMSEYCHAILQEQLQANTSEKGFSQYTTDPKTGLPKWRSKPIYTPSYWPDDLICMTTPKNFAARITDEVSRDIPLIEYEKDIKKAVHEFMLRFPADCNVAKLDICLVEYDDSNSTYVTWAS